LLLSTISCVSPLFDEAVANSHCPDIVIVFGGELTPVGDLCADGISNPIIPAAKQTGGIDLRGLEISGHPLTRMKVLLAPEYGLRSTQPAREPAAGKPVSAFNPVAVAHDF